MGDKQGKHLPPVWDGEFHHFFPKNRFPSFIIFQNINNLAVGTVSASLYTWLA